MENMAQYECNVCTEEIEELSITRKLNIIEETTNKIRSMIEDLDNHLSGPTPQASDGRTECHCLMDLINNTNCNLVIIAGKLEKIIKVIR